VIHHSISRDLVRILRRSENGPGWSRRRREKRFREEWEESEEIFAIKTPEKGRTQGEGDTELEVLRGIIIKKRRV